MLLTCRLKMVSGCTPIQTEPNPSAVAASRMFSLAALQSCTQNLSPAFPFCMRLLPSTLMAAGAFIFANISAWRNLSITAFSVTTTNSQGCAFMALGAAIAASSSCCSFSRSTGWSVNFRMLRLFIIVVSVSSNGLLLLCRTLWLTRDQMNVKLGDRLKFTAVNNQAVPFGLQPFCQDQTLG